MDDVEVSPQPRLATRMHSWLMRYPRALPAVVFLFIVALTATAVVRTEMAAEQSVQIRANTNSEAVARAIERRGQEFASLLETSKILFSAMGPISQTRFGILVGEVARDMELRGARAFGWVEVVEADGLPVARVTHLAPNRSYNTARIGSDLYAQPAFAPVLREAARTNVPTATGITDAISDKPGQGMGFSMVLPVYAEQTDGDVTQGDLTGFFYSNFEARNFVSQSIAQLDTAGLAIEVYDGSETPDNLFASYGEQLSDSVRITQPVTLGNRNFIVAVQTPHEGALTQSSVGLLLFGLTFACLMMLVAQWLSNRAIEDQKRLVFLEEQHSIRNSLSRELNHRVKNTLASVLSILALTRRRAKSLEQFADSLEGRIRSLSLTHDQIAETDWGTTPIRAVIEAELAHYGGEGEALRIEGPPLELAPGDALSFGLAVHELVTNAAKFGALSVPEGRVEVRWHISDEAQGGQETAIVEWIEIGGPVVPAERTRGFGSELIERLVPAQLKQKVELEFHPDGVRCVFGVPVRRPREFQLREKHEA